MHQSPSDLATQQPRSSATPQPQARTIRQPQVPAAQHSQQSKPTHTCIHSRECQYTSDAKAEVIKDATRLMDTMHAHMHLQLSEVGEQVRSLVIDIGDMQAIKDHNKEVANNPSTSVNSVPINKFGHPIDITKVLDRASHSAQMQIYLMELNQAMIRDLTEMRAKVTTNLAEVGETRLLPRHWRDYIGQPPREKAWILVPDTPVQQAAFPATRQTHGDQGGH